jgi:hypothetical protein
LLKWLCDHRDRKLKSDPAFRAQSAHRDARIQHKSVLDKSYSEVLAARALYAPFVAEIEALERRVKGKEKEVAARASALTKTKQQKGVDATTTTTTTMRNAATDDDCNDGEDRLTTSNKLAKAAAAAKKAQVELEALRLELASVVEACAECTAYMKAAQVRRTSLSFFAAG